MEVLILKPCMSPMEAIIEGANRFIDLPSDRHELLVELRRVDGDLVSL